MIPLHFDGRGISSEASLSRSRGSGDSVDAESVAEPQPSPEGAACGDRARSVPIDPTSPLLEDDIHTVKRNPAEQARMDAHNPSDGIHVSPENNAGEIVPSVHRAMLPFPEGSAFNVWGQADAYSPLDGIMATNYAVLGRERPYMGRVGCTLSERSQVLPASMLYSVNNYTPNKTPFHDNNIILHPENSSELTQRSPPSRKNKPIIAAGSWCAELPSQRLNTQTYSTNDWLNCRCTKWQKQRIYPDIFVDASGKGIGLTMGSNWLAWSFNRSVPRNSNGSIDISWAELVAVELGIRTAQAMGRKCTTITIFSDNKGVVKAMQTRSWDGDGKERLSQVMQRINDFCNKHHLYPEVMWVPTELNPADGPSRGNFLGLGEKDHLRTQSAPQVEIRPREDFADETPLYNVLARTSGS